MGDDERVRAIKTEFISLFVSFLRFTLLVVLYRLVPRWAWHRLSFWLSLVLDFPIRLPFFFFSFFSFSLDCINFHMSSWMRKRCVLSSRCPRRNFQTFWERGYMKRVRHLNAEAYPSQRMWCVPTVSILFSFPSKRYQMNSWLPPKKGWRTCGIFENFREHLEQHMCEGTWN